MPHQNLLILLSNYMNILILGGGGREHAFAWKLSKSSKCGALYIAPGNAGTRLHGENVNLNPLDFNEVGRFCLEKKIGMLIVGPEAPLVAGITDYFRSSEDLSEVMVIGPSKAGALLEGSKAFAKAFMQEFNIPTAGYGEFTKDNKEEGIEFIKKQTPPIVLKADGLAGGKGVLIIEDKQEAIQSFDDMLNGKFGEASEKIVIEDFLDGIEYSMFVMTDGKNYQVLPIAKDYKRIGEGDTGLNTGGMGAVSPVPFVDKALFDKTIEKIVKPTVKGLGERGLDYIGFVFIGLIKVGNEPMVIEYNCRMGDPETEAVFLRVENDLLENLIDLAQGNIQNSKVVISEKAASTVILVSGGYPEKYEKGKIIHGIDQTSGSIIFHSGTRLEGDSILTNGGRVIAISSIADSKEEALALSKRNAEIIDFEGKYYRKDIGFDL